METTYSEAPAIQRVFYRAAAVYQASSVNASFQYADDKGGGKRCGCSCGTSGIEAYTNAMTGVQN